MRLSLRIYGLIYSENLESMHSKETLSSTHEMYLKVLYRLHTPAPGGPVTMAITHPRHVVVIKQSKLKVEFHKIDAK